MTRSTVLASLGSLLAGSTLVLAGESSPVPQDAAKEARPAEVELNDDVWEKKFQEDLSGAALIGTFTTVGPGEDESPKPDRYQIRRVSRLAGDYWLFHATYGDTKMPPLPLKVLWAGKTPVITMDDFTIPLLGTFSFRVLIDDDLYVGTWQHDEKRGHMIGRIEPIADGDPAE